MKKDKGQADSKVSGKSEPGPGVKNQISTPSGKRAWSHIIEKTPRSKGPGDNIYVFG